MPAKSLPKVPVDTKWFVQAMAAAGLSQNETAARMKLDRGSFSKTLRGIRRMQAPEMAALARVLGVDVGEVFTRSGALGKPGRAKLPSVLPAGAATLVGTLSAPQGVVDWTMGEPDGPFTLRVVGGLMDGAVLHGQPGDLDADGIHQGIVVLEDGRVLFRKFRKSFAKGRFDLAETFEMGFREDDVRVQKVFEVVGIGQIG
jgi:transcriptional regulator with XRE-family HTH domain